MLQEYRSTDVLRIDERVESRAARRRAHGVELHVGGRVQKRQKRLCELSDRDCLGNDVLPCRKVHAGDRLPSRAAL